MEETEMGATEAAKFLGIGRAAIYDALKKRRIRFRYNYEGKMKMKKSVLLAYKKGKYQRFLATQINGTRVFKKHNNLIPIKEASELANIPRHNLYYAVRHGLLNHEKVGSQYVFKIKDIKAYAKKYWGVRKENSLAL